MKKNQFFFPFLLLAVVLAGGILFFSGKNFLAQNSFCGCGPPPPEVSGEFKADNKQAFFDNQPIGTEMVELPEPQEKTVLGVQSDERWIEIDLSEQKLYAHNGGNIDYVFLVSSGKWAPTPTGEFRIWTKLRYTLMAGGSKARRTYYYLPNVPFTQYFYKGFGLHGTYWHNNFGHPMSHGCVNLATPDAEKLFYWTSPDLGGKSSVYASKENPGTRVVIHN